MTNINWIFLSLIILSLGLYITASFLKIDLLKKISSVLMLPLLAALNISFLLRFLPDSRHVIITTGIALTLASITEILYIFENSSILRTILRVTFLLLNLAWMELYRSAFYIYRFSRFFAILMGTIYAGLLIYVLIMTGKQPLFEYFLFIAALLSSMTMHFSSAVFLRYNFGFSSILLFIGTSLNLFHTGFYILDYSKYHFKYSKKINLLFIILSQTLIAFSNLILIS